MLGSNIFAFYQPSKKQSKTPLEEVQKLVEEGKSRQALDLALVEYGKHKASGSHHDLLKWSAILGDIFRKNSDFGTAIRYYRESLKSGQRINDSLGIMNAHLNIGSTYLKNYRDKQELDDSTEQRLIKLSEFHFDKILNDFAYVKTASHIRATTLKNLSGLYSYTGRFDKAETAAEEAYTIYESLQDTLSMISAKSNLAVAYIFKEDYNKARDMYLDYLPLLKDTANFEILLRKEIAITNLSYIHEQMEDYEKAFEYQLESSSLNYVIEEKTKAAEIKEIEAKYNADQIKKAEAVKTAEETAKKARFQKWTTGLAIAIIGLVIALYFISKNSRLKQQNLQLQLFKQEFEKQRELEKLQIENQYKVINATLDGRELERKSIAQTLHDSVSALLSSANLHVQALKFQLKETPDELKKTQRIITEASGKIRDLSHQLISSVLLKFGLEYALQDICEKYSNSQIKLICNCDDSMPRFDENFEIKVYNITEELINNILKHSKASKATIQLHYKDDRLTIRVSDNGVGFDTDIIGKKGGIGLSQIGARIKNLKGKVKITSDRSQGTKVQFTVPAPLRV